MERILKDGISGARKRSDKTKGEITLCWGTMPSHRDWMGGGMTDYIEISFFKSDEMDPSGFLICTSSSNGFDKHDQFFLTSYQAKNLLDALNNIEKLNGKISGRFLSLNGNLFSYKTFNSGRYEEIENKFRKYEKDNSIQGGYIYEISYDSSATFEWSTENKYEFEDFDINFMKKIFSEFFKI